MISARKRRINFFLKTNKRLLKGLIVDLGGSKKFKETNKHLFNDSNKYFSVNKDKNSKCDHISNFPDINLPKNYADNVLCLETIEYISDPIKFLKNIHELLKKNGYLIISSPFMFPIHHDYESDYYRLSISFYKKHLDELFHFEKIVTTGGLFEILFDSIRIKFSYKINFINKFFLLIWSILRPIFTFLDFCIFKDNHYVNSGYILVLKKI